MRKTLKAALDSQLGIIKLDEPEADYFIIDGNEMLYRSVWPKAGNVRQLSANFNKAVARDRKEVQVLFDKYSTSSIKAHERNRRAGDKVYPNYNLTLDTDLPSRDKIMKNTHNKEQVIKLLCEATTMSSVHMVGMNSIYGHEEADVSINFYQVAQFPIDQVYLIYKAPMPLSAHARPRETRYWLQMQVGLYIPLNPPPLAHKGS